MSKGRLEAFSDAVVAIIITIMVLELKVPHGASPADLLSLKFVFLSYVLSFVNIAMYWNNHHHMFHSVNKVSGGVLWANVHLLFWLSLFPFATAWMGENDFTQWPVVLYGIVSIMSAIAYFFLEYCLISIHGKDSAFAKALGKDWKGKTSLILYTSGIGFSFIHPLIGFAFYVVVAAIWFIPDRRFEKKES